MNGSHRWLWDFAIALILAALAYGYFAQTMRHTLDLRDEGYLLNRSALVAAGEVPHRDFVDAYGPLVFGLTGQALRASGGEIIGVRILLALLKCLAVVATYGLVRLLTPRSWAIAAALLAIAYWGRPAANLNTPYASIYTLPLCLLSTLGVVAGLRRADPRLLVAGGVAAGLGILCKQSVGIMHAYGLALALWGVLLLEPREKAEAASQSVAHAGGAKASDRSTRLGVAVFWLGAAAVLVPLSGYLRFSDYVLHFLPFHLCWLACGVAALRMRGTPAWGADLRSRLAPYALGVGSVLVATALVYAFWGRLDRLIFDMFVLPRSVQNYYFPVVLPPLSLSVFGAGILAVLHAGILGLRREGDERRMAWVWLGGGLATMGLGRFAISFRNPELYTLDTLLRAPYGFEGVLAPVLALLATTFVLVPALIRRRARASPAENDARTVRELLPVLAMIFMLSFQVFPRAAHNLWMLHGVLPPLAVVVGYHWVQPWRFERFERATNVWRRRLAASLAPALVAMWLVNPIVRAVFWPTFPAASRRVLDLPRTSGLSLPRREIRVAKLADLEKLVAYLETLEPRSAPLFVLSNEEMIRFFARRPHLFPEQEFALFLAGWGMLPTSLRGELDGDDMVERLRGAREAILVHHADATSTRMRSALPRLAQVVETEYEGAEQFGAYRVLRHRLRPQR